MAKIHDLFIVELAEVIKGYGNDPDDKDPFRLSEFYRFYELPNIAVSRENFEKMRHIEPETEEEAYERGYTAGQMAERKTGKWLPDNNNYYEERFICSVCRRSYKVDTCMGKPMWDFCPCGADMREKVSRND